MHPVSKALFTSFFGATSGISWLCQAFDVQSSRDSVLYGGPVALHYRADGLS